jgi:hypothetical protein
MTDEIVHYDGARSSVLATLPRMLPAALTHGALISAVAAAAETTARAAAAARYAVVKVRRENEIAIQFLDEERRVLREDIIPVMAIVAAHDKGRRAVRSYGLDADLLEDALADMERKRQQRRDRL